MTPARAAAALTVWLVTGGWIPVVEGFFAPSRTRRLALRALSLAALAGAWAFAAAVM